MMMIGAEDHDSSNVHIPTTRRMMDADQNSSNAQTITFPFRLYQMLEEAETGGFGDIVSWLPDGNGFIVHDREQFTSHVIKTFFSHTKWKSFLRQLNLYNFERLSKRGPGQGSCYAHPCLIRGEIELCKQIHRSTTTNTAKRPATVHQEVFDRQSSSSSSFIMEGAKYFRKDDKKKRVIMRSTTAAVYTIAPSSEVMDLVKDGIHSITLFHSIMEETGRPFFSHGGVVGILSDTDKVLAQKAPTTGHDHIGMSSNGTIPLIANHDSTHIRLPQTTICHQPLWNDDHDDHDQKQSAAVMTARTFRSSSMIPHPLEAPRGNNKNDDTNSKHEVVEEGAAPILDHHNPNNHEPPQPDYDHDGHHENFVTSLQEQLSCNDCSSLPVEESSSSIGEASIARRIRTLLLSCSPNPIGSKNTISPATNDQARALQSLLLECSGTVPEDIADAIVSTFRSCPT